MTKKELKIKYQSGWTKERELLFPKYDYISVTNSHTKRYHNCLYLLLGLNGCCRGLLDYLTENMDKDNCVYNTKESRSNFIETVKKVTNGEEVYKDDTVNKAYQKLAEKDLLISKGRGTYQVNPEFFMKNDDGKRPIMLQLLFEEGKDTNITTIIEDAI